MDRSTTPGVIPRRSMARSVLTSAKVAASVTSACVCRNEISSQWARSTRRHLPNVGLSCQAAVGCRQRDHQQSRRTNHWSFASPEGITAAGTSLPRPAWNSLERFARSRPKWRKLVKFVDRHGARHHHLPPTHAEVFHAKPMLATSFRPDHGDQARHRRRRSLWRWNERDRLVAVITNDSVDASDWAEGGHATR